MNVIKASGSPKTANGPVPGVQQSNCAERQPNWTSAGIMWARAVDQRLRLLSRCTRAEDLRNAFLPKDGELFLFCTPHGTSRYLHPYRMVR